MVMKSIAMISTALLLSACAAHPIAMTATPAQQAVVNGGGQVSNGDAVQGRALFTKLRCDSCHALSGQARKVPHPLPDLSAQPPDAVAALITQHGELAPEALFDDMVMSQVVSQMTPQDLAHLVAYLRNPPASRRSGSE